MPNEANHLPGEIPRSRINPSATSPANLQVFTRVVDVGYSSRPIEPVKLKFVTGEPYPFPSEELVASQLPGGQKKGFRGKWKDFENDVIRRVKRAIEPNTIVILPEFAGSQRITDAVRETLSTTPHNCTVICGSYYRETSEAPDPEATEADPESVCPIVLPGGAVWEQLKFAPAPAERRYRMREPNHRVLYIFQNTGYGDFSVLVCSDALLERCEPALKAIRNRIDLLIVVARNTSKELPNGLRSLSAEERWIIAYCNGGIEDSCVYTPLRNRREYKLVENPEYVSAPIINVNEKLVLHGDAQEEDVAGAEQPFAARKRVGGFHPGPRHYAMSARSAVDFRRHAKVLAIGSHFDDVWLGCAATLMLLKEGYCAQIACVSLCTEYPHLYFGQYDLGDRIGDLNRFCEGLCAALGFTWIPSNLPGTKHLSDRGFSDNLPGLSDRMRELWELYHDADLVFVPRHDDSQDDHVLTAKAALAQFKKSTVLEYEVKEFRRVPFQPSVIVDVSRRSRRELSVGSWEIFPPPEPTPYLSSPSSAQEAGSAEDTFAWKKACILKYGFASFLGGEIPSTFEPEATLGRMRVRASESSGEPRFAEAFATEILIS